VDDRLPLGQLYTLLMVSYDRGGPTSRKRKSAPVDIDHPAVGAAHIFIPGGADSLVTAALLVRRMRWPTWVMLAREHRLPVVLERPLVDAAKEIWCLGYAGTGHPLLPSAMESHTTRRPFHWLSTTSGRLVVAAGSMPGVSFHGMPGGSLVPLAQGILEGGRQPGDSDFERLGLLLGRFSGAVPDRRELRLLNLLHAAAVKVRNQERRGPGLVRELADAEPGEWASMPSLQEVAREGEWLIKRSRQVVQRLPPKHGQRTGPAVWVVARGEVARGAHGKSVAARVHARGAPVGLVERTATGFTKAWVVVPKGQQDRFERVAQTFAAFSNDFSYTGLRGAGAIEAADVNRFALALYDALKAEGPG
jgi:hypothetical protein